MDPEEAERPASRPSCRGRNHRCWFRGSRDAAPRFDLAQRASAPTRRSGNVGRTSASCEAAQAPRTPPEFCCVRRSWVTQLLSVAEGFSGIVQAQRPGVEPGAAVAPSGIGVVRAGLTSPSRSGSLQTSRLGSQVCNPSELPCFLPVSVPAHAESGSAGLGVTTGLYWSALPVPLEAPLRVGVAFVLLPQFAFADNAGRIESGG